MSKLSPASVALKAVNLISDMIAYWDKDERCVFANAAYADWFGLDPEHMLGVHAKDVLGVLYAPNVPRIHAVLRGEPQEFERFVTTPSGASRHVLARYTPDVVDGAVAGFTAHVVDVTALRKREAALDRSMTLLDRVGALAQVGGAELDLQSGEVFWTTEMCRILDVDPAHFRLPRSGRSSSRRRRSRTTRLSSRR